jgi:hypothetical protein
VRRFILNRLEDASGVSGIGPVAEGVCFTDGTCVIRWTVALKSTAVYADAATLEAIHGHEGRTQIRWVD